jgi:hypothetical protein
MRTELELMKQIHKIENDLKIMASTGAKVA